jgi:ubiquinone/menaquinone biosynthesis C-methylase UbiE
MSAHDETVRREFTKQAKTFEDPTYSFADRRLMAWILEHVPPEPDGAVLDVAGGTGHLARAYAPMASIAIVVDLTAEMLATGRHEAEAASLRNLVYVLGDAARMPFVDASFDLVVSRFAVHHFEEPARQIGEMVRVCRPGGRVAIVDLVAADAALAVDADRLETMRDPSHTHALPVDRLKALLEQAGATVVHETFHDQALPVARWLAQAETPSTTGDEIRAELDSELDGGRPTGMRPQVVDGELDLTHRYAIVVAEVA